MASCDGLIVTGIYVVVLYVKGRWLSPPCIYRGLPHDWFCVYTSSWILQENTPYYSAWWSTSEFVLSGRLFNRPLYLVCQHAGELIKLSSFKFREKVMLNMILYFGRMILVCFLYLLIGVVAGVLITWGLHTMLIGIPDFRGVLMVNGNQGFFILGSFCVFTSLFLVTFTPVIRKLGGWILPDDSGEEFSGYK